MVINGQVNLQLMDTTEGIEQVRRKMEVEPSQQEVCQDMVTKVMLLQETQHKTIITKNKKKPNSDKWDK